MAVGDLITEDYQYEYNNVLFGVDTDFDVIELSSFLGYPSVRSSTEDNFGQHGGTRGRHYVPTRQFIMQLRIIGQSDPELYSELRRQVAMAFAPRSHPSDDLQFAYQLPGVEKRFISCRPIAIDMPLNREYSLDYAAASIRFECADPRHYSLIPKEETATLPSAGGGLDFPLDFPLNFTPGSTNSILVNNAGDAPAHWTGVITGPVIDPMIEATNDITQETYHLEFHDINMVEGESLVLTSSNRGIMLNGQSKRNSLVPGSKWWVVPPFPAQMTIHYTSADDPITDSTFTITWSDATWGS